MADSPDAESQFTVDSDDPARIEYYKNQLLDWVTQQDMLQEFSLAKVTQHRFKIDIDEAECVSSFEHVAKLMKVLVYKIGLAYKRQDLIKEELIKQIDEKQKHSFNSVQKDISFINKCILDVTHELSEHTTKQRQFRDQTSLELQKFKDLVGTSVAKSEQYETFVKTSAVVQACQAENL